MNRWILRGLTTAGCAAGWWLLTAAPAYADAPVTTTAHHAESGTLLGLRLDLNARPLLRTHADTTHRSRARAISARATGSVSHTMTNKTGRRTTARVTRNLTHHDTNASARVSAAVTPTTGGVATAHLQPDQRNRPAITDTTRPTATATACLSVLTLYDCGTRGTSTTPAAAIRTAASLGMESLDVCLNVAVLHATTVCGAEPPTRPSTAGGVVELCLSAGHLGDTVGCGTASGDQPAADGMAGAEALDPVALEACVVVGVLGDAASCGSGTTTPGGGSSGGGVDACLAVGPTGCDSPAGTDGIDPGTGTDYGTGVGPAGNDDQNYDFGQAVQGVFAAYGDALTGEITDLQRTAQLPLTGSALAGIALALVAAGLLLIVGSRRRRLA